MTRATMSTSLAAPPTTSISVPAGLTTAEAMRRLGQFGPNSVAEEKIHPVKRVLYHFWAPVPWMLEVTIALQLAIGERVEAVMVTILLILNVALGILQESRANAALTLLRQRLALKVRIRRDERWGDGLAADLVPGDIVQLSLGTIIPRRSFASSPVLHCSTNRR
jgi:H+-transporting ATPase